MEGDELSEFLVTKLPKKSTEVADTGPGTVRHDEVANSLKREPLTTKIAIKLLLEGTLKIKVCRYCLNVDSPLHEMDQVFQIGGQGTLYKVSIRDMVASFHPFTVVEDSNFPTKICEKCLENAMQSYLFTQQCERAGRALRNCFEDIYEKLEKLDPLERPKKRGRQKLNPNYNTLYTEHKNVINYADPIINIVNKGTQFIEKTDSKVNELECPRCWQVFTNLESLFNHEKIHSKSMWFSCSICGNSFPKRHLYRKHVKSNHGISELALPNTSFKCMECGVGNETYDTHLQHVEKHKFQMVMEHLLERKMDKLCTVCMSKGINMVNLDKTVNVHGGCPELTGQMNLYNILGSTMPESIPYKYRELQIPHQAHILTLNRKQNIKSDENEANILMMNNEKYHYSLSEPIIISRENFETDDYLFFFAKPIIIEHSTNTNKEFEEEFQKENKTSEENIDEDVGEAIESIKKPYNTSDSRNAHLAMNNCVNSEKKVVFTFSKPEYLIGVKNVPKTLEHIKTNDNAVESYKVNWVFEKCGKKRNADTLDKDYTAKNQETQVAITEECKYCWMFKNTDKCDICSKPNKNFYFENNTNTGYELEAIDMNEENKAITEIEVTELPMKKTDGLNNNSDLTNKDKESKVPTIEDCKYCWIFKNTDKCNKCTKLYKKYGLEYNMKSDTIIKDIEIDRKEVVKNKRKNDDDSFKNYGGKRSKWQCKFCLTSNNDNTTCDCCDSEYSDNSEQKHIKINLGIHKSFFENAKVDRNFSSDTKDNIETSQQGSIIFTMTNKKHGDTKESQVIINKIETATEVQQGLILKEDIIMDTEFENSNIEHNLFEINNKHIFQDEMDVEECNDTYNTIPMSLTTGSNNIHNQNAAVQFPIIPNAPFNFQMGVGTSEDKGKFSRRFKRPLKRMPTSFHK